MRRFALLVLILWLSRLPGLETLPLHNDEGLHLTRAVEVWNLHPFWEIRDGKVINHWAIALFYPQNAPVFAGRIATIFVSVVGFAAGYALVRRAFGANAALLAGALWIACPYLFFFERLALSDAEAGALVVLALWAGWLLAERGTMRRTVFAGLALAALFKFTAAPFAVGVALVVLLRARYPVGRRVGLLAVAAVVVALCFAVPVGYLLLGGDDLFSIALARIGGGSGAQAGIVANLDMLRAQLTGFSLPIWSMLMLVGLGLLTALRLRDGGVLLLAVGAPLASIIVLGRDAAAPLRRRHPRFGAGRRGHRHWDRSTGGAGTPAHGDRNRLVPMAAGSAPFALHAYTEPDQLRVPDAIWTQYFSQHSSGYGLREAVLALPETTPDIHYRRIASMTADSCHRANYATPPFIMDCTGEPQADLQAALADATSVYVVVESVTGAHFPQDADALDADAELIATYHRPTRSGEAEQPVTVWKLTRR
ncbi:MAG: glycosyltransferase family 39 protein [Anaerolineae bacterium]